MVFVSIEEFSCKGGWFVDSQFMDQMGSPYLLAHGLGKPVEDAIAKVVMDDGEHRMWVKTRDWVSPYGPGRFVIKIGDWTSKELGVGNGEWHWDDCGIIPSVCGEVEVRLHDLSGFDGRCAAIAFTDVDEVMTDEKVEEYKRNTCIVEKEEFDFVVVGGGYAGMCAAVSAARRGVKIALIQDRPVLGGNASSEVRVGPIGKLGLKPYPKLSNLAYELVEVTTSEGVTSGGLRPKPNDMAIEKWVRGEKNLTMHLSARCVGARVENGVITQIDVEDITSNRRFEITAKFFADCTGDAILAELAGAEMRTKPEIEETLKGDYGSTNFWTTRWTKGSTSFPTCLWALQINEENWQINRPKFFVEGNYPYAAGWNWEGGFGKDQVKDAEWIRDYNFRAAYGMWDYLKNKASDKVRYANAEMDWLGYVLGKRAARRIVGDYVLNEKDLTEHRVYSDGVVTATWFLDLHFPHPMNAKWFPEGAFRSMAYDDPMYEQLGDASKGHQVKIEPYPIPYRCFYSKNINNLFMAGKDISCTHVGMSAVRVENTTAMMGTLVGEAASLCILFNWSPRELGEMHFGALSDQLHNLKMTALSKRGRRRYQHRIGIKNEIKYWLRPIWHLLKGMVYEK